MSNTENSSRPQMPTASRLGHIWLLGGLTSLALIASLTSLALLWRSGATVVRSLYAATSSTESQVECSRLEQQIDSLIELSRTEKVSSLGASKPASLPKEATACGLSLVEFSLAPQTGKRGTSGETKWRMVCMGSARSWGQFLSMLENSQAEFAIVSGTWSCKGLIDRDVRGDIVLAGNP